MAGESIKFNASLDTIGFSSGAKAMQDIASKASASVANHFAKMAGAVLAVGAAFVGVRAAAQSFSAAIALGGQLNDLSARTGESAGNLLILRRAFENAGAGADSVGPTINRLQRAIVEAGQGGKEQAEAFSKLGLNLEELKGKTPTEQLQAVGNALARVSTDSDRSALAMQLLGRSGGELIPLLRAMGSELDVARAQLGSTPEVMNKVSQAFDTIGDNLGAIGEKSTEFAAGLLEKLAPALAEITTKIANIDAAGLGQAISGYIEATMRWITASLGLGTALQNVRTAIDGITSGNIGDGFSLMFLTARDTAFNAINHIVAAGMAALQTIGNALAQLFSPNSTTMAFINGAFTMLGANLAVILSSTIASALEATAQSIPDLFRPIADGMANSFLPGLSFMGEQLQGILDGIDMSGVSTGLREIENESKKAVQDITNIMHYEADNLKSEFSDVGKAMPENFAAAYQANMKDPLIDMKDRTLETAAAAEKLAAAVRAAGFDAKTFGDNMASAREEMLAGGGFNPFGGPPETGEIDMGVNPDNRKFPFQGAGPSGPPIIVPGGPTGGSSKGGRSSSAPKSPLDRLQEMSKGGDVDARTALMRLQAEQDRYAPRAAQLEQGGMLRSAASAQIRNENRMQGRAMTELTKQTREQFFGARNAGDATRNFEREAFRAGMTNKEAMDKMGIDRKLGESTRSALDRFAKEQAKTETERAREQADSGGGGGGGGSGGGGAGDQLATEATLKQIFEKIQERPILVA